MMTVGRAVCWVLGAVLLLGSTNAPVSAEQDPSSVAARLEALETSVKDHKRSKDTNGLLDDIKQLVQLHGDAARDPKVRTGVIKVLGELTKARGRTVPTAALEALGRTADLAGAKFVRTHLKLARANKECPPTVPVAVKVAAQIPADNLVEPLLKIVTTSKNFIVAAEAVKSLSHFRGCKRKRVKILKTLVKTTEKDRPGVKGDAKPYVPGDQYRHTGDLARNRWAALSSVLPAALSRLTGQDVGGGDVEVWIQVVKDNERNLGELFLDEG